MIKTKQKRIEELGNILKILDHCNDKGLFEICGMNTGVAEIKKKIGKLYEEDREIIDMYFFKGKTQQEIADKLQVTQPLVNMKIKNALTILDGRLFE